MIAACIAKSPAERRYVKRVWFAMTVYIIAILSVSWMFKHHPSQGARAYVLAILPALPVLSVIAFFGIYLAEVTDDFERTVLVQSSLWATGVVLTASTFWGFLQNYVLPAANLPMYWVFIVWWFSLGAAQPLVRRRYQ